MAMETLSGALEREHHEIDAGIEAYTATRDPQTLATALTALRRHIYLEEEYLFPPLRDAGLVGPVFVMLREHGELWDAMAELEALLRDPARAEDASAICQDLLGRLAAHNGKEEPIVYPEVDALDAAAEALDFLYTDTMPEGWACAHSTSAKGSAPRALPF